MYRSLLLLLQSALYIIASSYIHTTDCSNDITMHMTAAITTPKLTTTTLMPCRNFIDIYWGITFDWWTFLDDLPLRNLGKYFGLSPFKKSRTCRLQVLSKKVKDQVLPKTTASTITDPPNDNRRRRAEQSCGRLRGPRV